MSFMLASPSAPLPASHGVVVGGWSGLPCSVVPWRGQPASHTPGAQLTSQTCKCTALLISWGPASPSVHMCSFGKCVKVPQKICNVFSHEAPKIHPSASTSWNPRGVLKLFLESRSGAAVGWLCWPGVHNLPPHPGLSSTVELSQMQGQEEMGEPWIRGLPPNRGSQT